MAGKNSNTTDKLVIDIKVNVKKGATAQITNLTKSLTKLNEVVKNTANIEKYANALRTIGKELTRATGNKGVSKTQLGNKNYTETTEVVTKDTKLEVAEVNNLRGAYEEVNKTKAKLRVTTQTLKDGTQQEVKLYTEYINGLKRTTKEINGITVAQKTQEEQSKKTTTQFGKFAKSVGRIALYRTIRSSLSLIVKSAKEGLSIFAQYDEATQSALSNINASANQIKATLGVTLGNLLVSLEPVITSLSDTFVKLTDNVNKALAIVQGEDTYQKAIKNNEEYAKSLDETNEKLLSFDKFESLDKAGGIGYSPEAISDEDKESLAWLTDSISGMFTLVEELKPIIIEIFKELTPLIKDIIPIIQKSLEINTDSLLDMVSISATLLSIALQLAYVLLDYFTPALSAITALASGINDIFIGTLSGLLAPIKALVKILKGDLWGAWQEIANGFASSINGIANLFISLGKLVVEIINQMIKPIDMVVRFFGGSGFQIPTSWGDYKVAWKPYADGGMVEKGTRFIAGEAGAEVVHTSARGTGVTNIEQFSQAMLQALATYGVARGSDVSFKGDVYIDRTKAGQLLEGSVYGEGVRVGHFKRV